MDRTRSQTNVMEVGDQSALDFLMPYYRVYRVYRLENVHPLGAPSTGSEVVGRRARRFASSRT